MAEGLSPLRGPFDRRTFLKGSALTADAAGVLVKLDGKPVSPGRDRAARAVRHRPGASQNLAVAAFALPAGSGRQCVYHPYRVTMPLKRTGPRGSGRWQAISWSQLITEVTEGGRLFGGIPGEENREVTGFKGLWDGGAATRRPIVAASPDLRAQTNGLVMYYSFAEPGQTDFLA